MLFHSEILNKDMGVSVYVPERAKNAAALPVLYFLHGRSGSEEILSLLKMDSLIEKMLNEGKIEPFILVCPRMENSRDVNASAVSRDIPTERGVINTGRYEDYFINEIIPLIDKNYPTGKARSDRWIGGISSGGYAALHLAFRHPELFSKVGGHMPAVELSLDAEDMPYFGNYEVWEKYDPLRLAKSAALSPDTRVYLDAGDCDEGHFYEGCKVLYDTLRERGTDVQNHVFPGHHDAEYVLSNLRRYFEFYAGI